MEAKKAVGKTIYRAAVKGDAPEIAALFRISSDGVAEYVWSGMSSEYPGLSPIEIGAARYSSKDGNFSYRNCVVAERDGEVVGLLCTFPIPDRSEASSEPSEPSDPVMEPYERLEAPGSLYICSLALFDGHRGAGIGTEMLSLARSEARDRGFDILSLLVFEENEGAVRLYEREGFRVAGRAAVVPHEKIHHTSDVLLMVASPDGK